MDIRLVREFLKQFPNQLLCKKDQRQLLPNLRHDDTIEIGYNSYDKMKAALIGKI